MRPAQRHAGFTLVELVLVIALLGVVGTLGAGFIALGPVVFDLAVLQTYSVMKDTVLAAIPFEEVRCNGYAFQIEMSYRTYCKGFRLKEIPIIFVSQSNRAVAQKDHTAG